MPFVKPVTVMGELVPVTVVLPGLTLTTYPVTTPPPLFDGALNLTTACPLPAVTVGLPGADGVPLEPGDGGELIPVPNPTQTP